jgi:HlyD family secretion protein
LSALPEKRFFIIFLITTILVMTEQGSIRSDNMKRLSTMLVVALILVVVCAGGAWFMWSKSRSATVRYNTAPVKKGNLVATIGATGTVEPEEVVDVGAQVAGQINVFGKDKNGKAIDYGSEVETDMVLARIDDALYAADAAQAVAQLQQANAQLTSAEANLKQLQAKFRQADRDWQRAQKIGPSDALAQSSYDAYQAAYETAQADVTTGEAAILLARGAIAQSVASVQRTKCNLDYCVIKSPVKGVIIDRRVNIGQTVVASLNAPSLFLIAKDLKRIQVWVAVNEADIGNINPGQPVTFTVDAYPNREFKGEVGKVRLNATMTQNVVTYTIEVIADNADGKLLPYLTANAKFEVDHHENVLMVPDAALRWSPTPQQIAPDARETHSRGSRSGGSKSPGTGTAPDMAEPHGTVWIQEGEFARPIRVRTGLNDGLMTEVSSDKLAEGTEVIVSSVRPGGSAAANGGGVSPFAPQMPGRR